MKTRDALAISITPRILVLRGQKHGAIMAATVLKSKRAIEMSVFVVRAFVHLRDVLTSNRQVMVKIEELEKRLESHDGALRAIVQAIKELMTPTKARRKIGFRPPAMGKPA